MKFTALTDQQRRNFDENGYLVVPEALDRNTINRLIEVCDRFMETQGPIHNFYANRYIDMTLDASLIALATNPLTTPLVVQLMAPDLRLMRTHLMYKYPQPASDTPIYPDGDGRKFRNWHRDLNNFAPNHPIRNTVAIRIGYCLTDFTLPNSGMTLLVPGSHKLIEPLQFKKGALDPPDFIELPLKAGDAYLFSVSLYHTPAINFTDTVARGLLVSYAYSWWSHTHPVPDDGILNGMDDLTAQLFGRPADGDQTPLKVWARQNGLPADDPPMRVFV